MNGATGCFQKPGPGIGGVCRNVSRAGSIIMAVIGGDSEARIVAKQGEETLPSYRKMQSISLLILWRDTFDMFL